MNKLFTVTRYAVEYAAGRYISPRPGCTARTPRTARHFNELEYARDALRDLIARRPELVTLGARIIRVTTSYEPVREDEL